MKKWAKYPYCITAMDHYTTGRGLDKLFIFCNKENVVEKTPLQLHSTTGGRGDTKNGAFEVESSSSLTSRTSFLCKTEFMVIGNKRKKTVERTVFLKVLFCQECIKFLHFTSSFIASFDFSKESIIQGLPFYLE